MTTQYSIVSVLIRPEIGEKISIGLLLFDDSHIYFSYSRNKLQAAKILLSPSSFKLLRDNLDIIERKIEYQKSDYSEKRGFRIFKNSIFDKTFSSNYISYLSRYSNNVVSYTEPKEIGLSISDTTFENLFKKYVSNADEFADTLPRVKPVEFIKNHYGEKIKNHYDVNFEVTPARVNNLISPVRIDFTGSNNIDVYAQTVDMEASLATVTNHINSFMQLKLTYEENEVEMQDFVIAKEPLKKDFPKQHDIWRQLRKSPILNYLDLSESEKIVEYAEAHGVVPISKS